MRHISFLLLLPAALLSLVALQTASAQGNDGHNVTMDVGKVTAISGTKDVSIDIQQNLNADVTATNSYDIQTNASNRKVQVSLSQNGSTDVTGLKFEVGVTGSPTGTSQGIVSFTSLDDAALTTSEQDLVTGFGSVNETVGLEYTAQANEIFDPSATADFDLTYTVTNN